MLHGGITRADATGLVLRHLRDGGVDTPEADARILMQHATGLSQLELITRPAIPLSEKQTTDLENLLIRRLAGCPVARLVGHRDFWGLSFSLSEETLEPRPDSETIIEEALHLSSKRPLAPRRILDLGTGTGCLLIALLSELPHATGLGTDISTGALQTAALNAAANNVADRASFAQGSWSEHLNERFDLIVSNPPYIVAAEIGGLSREVRDHDPARALDGGPDGLDAYRAILRDLSRVMNPGAIVVLEIGAGQETELRSLATRYQLPVVSTRCDLGGHIRAVALQATAEM